MTMIVCDSSAYLMRAEAAAYRVALVPMAYSVDGKALFYSEGYIDECGDYERLVSQNIGRMRTSQATLGSFLSTFEDLTTAGHQVLCIAMSSRLSGTYANARMAAREFGGKVEVVDSLTTGGGIFLLIQMAREMLDSGMPMADVAARIRKTRDQVKTYFSVDDMTSLRRSGRLGNVRSSISTILNIKPLLKCENGGIVSSGIARGRMEQMRALMQPLGGHRGKVIVQDFLGGVQAELFAERLRDSGHDVRTRKVGPVLGVHLGRGAVGAAWIEET